MMRPFTVIGVMPADFKFPFGGVKAWVVVQPHLEEWDRDYRNFMPVARLVPGATRSQLSAELDTLYQGILSEHYPEEAGEPYVTVVPLREALLFLADIIHLMLMLLTVANIFVLLIICTNIANLFLVRAINREREIAVRAALGAGRVSLVRQLLIEGLVLALMGGALGVLLAHWLLTLVVPVIPEDLYRVGDIGIDATALVFTLLISVLTVGSFALPPALRALKADLGLALKEGSSGSGSSVRTRRSQSFLATGTHRCRRAGQPGVRALLLFRPCDPRRTGRAGARAGRMAGSYRTRSPGLGAAGNLLGLRLSRGLGPLTRRTFQRRHRLEPRDTGARRPVARGVVVHDPSPSGRPQGRGHPR